MRLTQLDKNHNNIILESFGLDKDPYNVKWVNEVHPLLLEVALSPDDIKQLFKNIETTASEQGSNRTAAGKAVDKAGEVSEKVKDLWFNKLGGALQQSDIVQGFDTKWEDIKSKVAAENPKLASSLSKYKEFADKNPKLQKFLLMVAASIAGSLGLAVAGGAAAGIAATGMGVGAGVAIVNIVDRLLKNEKLSTAVGRGATAGIVAGLSAAGVKAISTAFNSIVDALKPGQQYADVMLGNPPVKVRINAEDAAMLEKLHNSAMGEMGGQTVQDIMASGGATPGLDKWMQAGTEVAKRAANVDYQQAIADAAGAALDKTVSLEILQANAAEAAKTFAPLAGAVAGQAAGDAGEKKESYYVQTRPLSEGQVYLLLKKISEQQQLTEGPIWDKVKSGAAKAAGAVGKGVGAVATQVTTNATYPKLLAAWKLEGSPTDSEDIKTFLQNYGGITPETIDKVYSDMNLPSSGSAAPKTNIDNIKNLIAKLNTSEREKVISHLEKSLGTA